MKKSYFHIFYYCFSLFDFTKATAITVTQSIRYPNGKYVQLLTSQISKSKVMKTNNRKVLFKYDFSVEKSSSHNDILAFIYVPADSLFI